MALALATQDVSIVKNDSKKRSRVESGKESTFPNGEQKKQRVYHIVQEDGEICGVQPQFLIKIKQKECPNSAPSSHDCEKLQRVPSSHDAEADDIINPREVSECGDDSLSIDDSSDHSSLEEQEEKVPNQTSQEDCVWMEKSSNSDPSPADLGDLYVQMLECCKSFYNLENNSSDFSLNQEASAFSSLYSPQQQVTTTVNIKSKSYGLNCPSASDSKLRTTKAPFPILAPRLEDALKGTISTSL